MLLPPPCLPRGRATVQSWTLSEARGVRTSALKWSKANLQCNTVFLVLKCEGGKGGLTTLQKRHPRKQFDRSRFLITLASASVAESVQNTKAARGGSSN